MSRNPEASDSLTDSPNEAIQVRVVWKGVTLELPFQMRTVRVRDEQHLQSPVQARSSFHSLDLALSLSVVCSRAARLTLEGVKCAHMQAIMSRQMGWNTLRADHDW